MSYFTPETDPKLFRCGCGEAACGALPPSTELLARLDLLRYRYGKAIIVTSGPRCVAYNRAVGGALNSDHLTGEGADLAAADSKSRYLLLAANFGGHPIFRRLGVGREFLHVGVMRTKLQDICWTYYPKV